MDRTVSKVLAFEGDGKIVPIEGGYSDYLAWKERAVLREKEEKVATKTVSETAKVKKTANTVKKLAYKEQKELDELPAQIEAWEEEKENIEARFCDNDYFNKSPEDFQKDQKRLAELDDLLTHAFERWEALETKQQSF